MPLKSDVIKDVDNSKVLLTLIAIEILIPSFCGMWLIFYPLYLKEKIMVSSSLVAIIYSTTYILMVLGNNIGGVLGSLKGGFIPLFLGLMVAAAGTLLTCFPSFYATIGFPLYFFGISIASPIASITILKHSPQKMQGTSFMLATRVLPSIPPVLTLTIAGSLYENNLYNVSILIGFLAIVASILLVFMIKEDIEIDKESFEEIRLRDLMKNIAAIRKDLFFTLIIIAYGLEIMSFKGLEWYIPIYAVNYLNIDTLKYGFIVGITSLTIALGSFTSGIIFDFLGPINASLIGWSLLTLTSLLLSVKMEVSYALLLLFLWRFSCWLPRVIPPVMISRKYGRYSVARLSLYNSLMSIFSIPGPLFIIMLLALAPNMPFLIRGLLMIISGLLTTIALKKYL